MIKLSKSIKGWMGWLGLAVVLTAIFLFTAFQMFTGEHTKVIIQRITGLTEQDAYALNAIVRKTAHVIAFGLLGILLYRIVGRQSIVYAWLGATLMAVLDEWHQFFVPGRSPLFQDVILDSMAAWAVLWAIVLFKRNRER